MNIFQVWSLCVVCLFGGFVLGLFFMGILASDRVSRLRGEVFTLRKKLALQEVSE